MRLCVVIAIFLILACPGMLFAAPQSGGESDSSVAPKVEEMIETELPETQYDHELDFSLRPRASDAIREDYIRSPVRIKYGVTDRWQVSLEPMVYFDNFFRGEYGLYMTDVKFATKYHLGEFIGHGVDWAFSYAHIMPLRHDVRISDGYEHYMPAILLSRNIKRYKSLLVGLSIGADIVSGDGPEGTVRPDDTLSVSLGVHYRSKKVNYLLETIYITEEPYGGNAEYAYITPSLSLDVHDWMDNVPGIWTFGAGVRLGFLDSEDDAQLILKLKLHLRFDYKFDVKDMKWKKRT